MPITVPQINPTLLQGAAPSGLSNLLPGYLAGQKLAQERQVAESQIRATEATYQETLRNAANAARKLKRQEAYEAEVAALDINAADYRTKLFDIQTRFPDVVTSPQTTLLPKEPDPPTPETRTKEVKNAEFMFPDNLEAQRDSVAEQLRDRETATKTTTAITNAEYRYPYPVGATADQKAVIDQQRRDYVFEMTKKVPLVTMTEARRQTAAEIKMDEAAVTRMTNIQNDRAEAEKDNIMAHQMLAILRLFGPAGVRTGAAENAKMRFKGVMKGIFSGLDFEGLEIQQAFNAFGNRAALALKKMMPGPLSDKDIQFIMNSAPGLRMEEGGNYIMLSLLIHNSQRRILYEQLAAKYALEVSESGTVDYGFNEWVDKQPEWKEKLDFVRGMADDDGNVLFREIHENDKLSVLEGLPDYTVYQYVRGSGDEKTKTFAIKMPVKTESRSVPAETVVPEATVTEPPVTTETDLPFYDDIKRWESKGIDVLAILESGLNADNGEARAMWQRAIDLYKAGKY